MWRWLPTTPLLLQSSSLSSLGPAPTSSARTRIAVPRAPLAAPAQRVDVTVPIPPPQPECYQSRMIACAWLQREPTAISGNALAARCSALSVRPGRAMRHASAAAAAAHRTPTMAASRASAILKRAVRSRPTITTSPAMLCSRVARPSFCVASARHARLDSDCRSLQ